MGVLAGGDWEAESSGVHQEEKHFWGSQEENRKEGETDREREDQVFKPEFEVEKETGWGGAGRI